jgi:uncharacterized membrane protein YgaE (UPF0421/DUF939 family)
MSNKQKYSSKYHIEKEIDIIMNRLNIAKQNLQLFKELKSEKNVNTICSQFSYMFTIILNSLQEKSLLELAKLVVDYDNDSITINDLYNHYKKNKEIFRQKKYYMVKDMVTKKRYRFYFDVKNIDVPMQKLKNDLQVNSRVINYLKRRRNKSLAHNDKKLTFDTKIKYIKDRITYQEIENFIGVLIKDINEISSCIFGKQYAFIYSEIDEVNYLSDVLMKAKNID